MASTKNILITFAFLVFSILFFGLSDIDDHLQNIFYNFNEKHWLLLPYTQPYKFIFYDGIKKLLIVISVLFLFSLAFYKVSNRVRRSRRGILVVVLAAIFVPSITGLLKSNTNMPCPRDLTTYGGLYPKTKVWESFPQEILEKQHNKLKCWPAGHASGGFALMSFFFLFKRKRNRYIALGIALFVGWAMGTYKMIIGDHFFSHTFITMVLAWLVILIIAKLTKVEKEYG